MVGFLQAQEDQPKPSGISTPENSHSSEKSSYLEYTFSITSPLNAEINEHLKSIASLTALKETPPQSQIGLVKRAERDALLFQKYLLSIGYAEAEILYTVNDKLTPAHVEISIQPGESFKIGTINLEATDGDQANFRVEDKDLEDILGIRLGETSTFTRIQESSERLEKFIGEMGYPFVIMDKPDLEVDFKNKTYNLTYRFTLGPLGIIQETGIEGLKNLNPSFIANRVTWKKGDTYTIKSVNKMRRKLQETGLVGMLKVTPERLLNKPCCEGSTISTTPKAPIKMRIHAAESPPRTIGAGLRFATSEGVGGRVFWHHNNIRGNGEHLGISLKTSKRQRKAKIAYDIPDFLHPEQKLANEVSATFDRQRAFKGTTLSASSTVKRPIMENLTLGAGGLVENAKITQSAQLYKSNLLGVPLLAEVDTTEDFLNPTRGLRVNGNFTPHWGSINGQKRQISVVSGKSSLYIPFNQRLNGYTPLVLAGFIKVGSVLARERSSIPPNKRFYSGGGDSVRGYGYQLLGPLDNNRIPLGGLSMLEYGGELRIKTSETIGFAAFLEAGSVGDTKLPSFSGDKVFWGVGVGFRYYTSLGPVRLDLAFPLKRRKYEGQKTIDAPFQFYISFGQAF